MPAVGPTSAPRRTMSPQSSNRQFPIRGRIVDSQKLPGTSSSSPISQLSGSSVSDTTSLTQAVVWRLAEPSPAAPERPSRWRGGNHSTSMRIHNGGVATARRNAGRDRGWSPAQEFPVAVACCVEWRFVFFPTFPWSPMATMACREKRPIRKAGALSRAKAVNPLC